MSARFFEALKTLGEEIAERDRATRHVERIEIVRSLNTLIAFHENDPVAAVWIGRCIQAIVQRGE